MIVFGSVIWILGIVLSILLHPDLESNNEKAYQAMGIGVALSLPFGMVINLIKIMISVGVGIREKETKKCCYQFIVDIETVKIIEKLDKKRKHVEEQKRSITESPAPLKYENNPDDIQFITVMKPQEE